MCKKNSAAPDFLDEIIIIFIIIIDFSDYCLHHLLLLQTSFLVSEHLLIFRLQVPSSCPDGLPSIQCWASDQWRDSVKFSKENTHRRI